MAKAHSFPINKAHIQVTLKMTNSMVKANASGQTGNLTKAITKMTGSMAKAFGKEPTVHVMKAIIRKTKQMAKELTTIWMVQFILANGKMT